MVPLKSKRPLTHQTFDGRFVKTLCGASEVEEALVVSVLGLGCLRIQAASGIEIPASNTAGQSEQVEKSLLLNLEINPGPVKLVFDAPCVWQDLSPSHRTPLWEEFCHC